MPVALLIATVERDDFSLFPSPRSSSPEPELKPTEVNGRTASDFNGFWTMGSAYSTWVQNLLSFLMQVIPKYCNSKVGSLSLNGNFDTDCHKDKRFFCRFSLVSESLRIRLCRYRKKAVVSPQEICDTGCNKSHHLLKRVG